MDIKSATSIKGVASLFPEEIKKGSAIISSYEFKDSENPLFNLRSVRDGGMLFYMYDGVYCRLNIEGKGLVMSDTYMERMSNREFINKANGKVLIAGLGLGLVIYNIIDKDEVKEITVIENNQDVIDLVSDKFQNPKLTIICDDIYEWNHNKVKYDTIYFDIWSDVSEDNLADIRKLHNRYKFILNRDNPDCWMDSWMKKFLQNERRKNNRKYF